MYWIATREHIKPFHILSSGSPPDTAATLQQESLPLINLYEAVVLLNRMCSWRCDSCFCSDIRVTELLHTVPESNSNSLLEPQVNWIERCKDERSFKGNDVMNHTDRNILTVPPHRLLSCCRHLNNTKSGGTNCVMTEKRAEKGNSKPANVFIPMHLQTCCEKWVCMCDCRFQQVARYFLSGCFCVKHFHWSNVNAINAFVESNNDSSAHCDPECAKHCDYFDGHYNLGGRIKPWVAKETPWCSLDGGGADGMEMMKMW